MDKVLSGVTFTGKSTIADAENSTVICRHLSAHPTLGKESKFDLTWIFDFGACTKEEILCMAAEQAIIKNRRVFVKDSKPSDDEWNNATFDAKELVTTRMSRVDKARKMVATFTDEELEALGLTRS